MTTNNKILHIYRYMIILQSASGLRIPPLFVLVSDARATLNLLQATFVRF